MEIITVHDSVKALLLEICTFLNDEVVCQYGNKDPKLKAGANSLIRRSMQQVLELDNLAAVFGKAGSEGYLDMRVVHKQPSDSNLDSYVESDQPPQQDELYTNIDDSVDEEESPPDPTQEEIAVDEDVDCPFKEITLKQTNPEMESKLSRKEHLLGVVTQHRPYYVVLHKDWLLFFNQNKRGKPLDCYNIRLCSARSVDHASLHFELRISKTNISMLATTRIDKIKWIRIINEKANQVVMRSTSSSTPSNLSAEVKNSPELNRESTQSNESNNYEYIPEPVPPPKKSQIQFMELPSKPTTASYSNLQESVNDRSECDYDFLAASEENIYEDPEECKANAKAKSVVPQIDEEIYDYLDTEKANNLPLEGSHALAQVLPPSLKPRLNPAKALETPKPQVKPKTPEMTKQLEKSKTPKKSKAKEVSPETTPKQERRNHYDDDIYDFVAPRRTPSIRDRFRQFFKD